MKVLHITSPKTWRGGEQQLMYLTEELKVLRVEQIVMCPFNSAVHKYCLKHHINHVTYFKGFSANPMVAFRVAHVCKRESVDLIHVHDSHAHNFAVLSAVLTQNTTPIIVSRRVDFAIQGSAVSLFKYNHPRIRKIVCVSQAIANIMSEYIEDKSKLTVVYSGIDLSKFEGIERGIRLRSEFDIPESSELVGCVAALAPHKDYPTLVAAAKLLIDQGMDVHFVAIGEGPERKKIEDAIDEAKIGHRFHLAGFRTNVPQLLAELDQFVITSETEGLGTSVIDAMAMALPIVATSAGGIIELITHEESALLCAVKNPKQIAESIARMQSDQTLKKRLAQSAKQRAKLFSKAETARKTRKIYEQVYAESSSSKD